MRGLSAILLLSLRRSRCGASRETGRVRNAGPQPPLSKSSSVTQRHRWIDSTWLFDLGIAVMLDDSDRTVVCIA